MHGSKPASMLSFHPVHHINKKGESPVLKRSITMLLVASAVAIPAQTYANTTAPLKPFVVTDKAVRTLAADAGRVLYREVESEDLFLHDLRSGQTRKVADDVLESPVALEGARAAYLIHSEAESKLTLYLHDLTTDQRTEVVSDPLNLTAVALEQGKLIWGKPEGSEWVYYLEDTSSGARREIARIPNGDRYGPMGFDGRYMVWTELTGTSRLDTMYSRVIALDVTTGQKQVKSRAGAMQSAGVADGTVLYYTWKAGQTRENTTDTLYLWDVSANTEKWLAARTRPHYNGYEPAISETHAAWADPSATHVFNWRTREYNKVGDQYHHLTFGGNWLAFRLIDGDGGGTAVRAVGLDPADRVTEPKPEPPTKPVFYTVQPGDTLWKLQARFKATIAEIVRSNNMLNPNVINVGDVLFLPYPVSPGFEEVVVQPGDTLGKIAARFKTTVYNIAMTNQLGRADVVNAGQVLKVSRGPEGIGDGSRTYQTYAVQPGDSLWNVSLRSGVSMKQLMENNQWTEPVPLTVGQTIIIRK